MEDLFWLLIRTLIKFGLIFALPVAVASLTLHWWRQSGEAGHIGRQLLALLLLGVCVSAPFLLAFAFEAPKVYLLYGLARRMSCAAIPFVLGALLDLLRASARGREGKARDESRGGMRRAAWRSLGMIAGGILSSGYLALIPPDWCGGINANEISAAASLRAYVNAQKVFVKQGGYGGESEGVYANPVNGKGFVDLYKLGGIGSRGRELKLIDEHLARAANPKIPRSHYYFVEITADNNGLFDYRKQYGLCAVPAWYHRAGRNTFIVNQEGVVYGKDNGGKPVTTWPDIEAEGWLPVFE